MNEKCRYEKTHEIDIDTNYVLLCTTCGREFQNNPLTQQTLGVILQRQADNHRSFLGHTPELVDLKNKTSTVDLSGRGRHDLNVM